MLTNCFRIGCSSAFFALAAMGVSSAAPLAAPKVAIRTTSESVMIDAGSMGQFQLSYPALYGKTEKIYEEAKAYKLIERQPAGKTATLSYAGGVQARLDVQSDNTLLMTFTGLTDDIGQLRMGMHIDINYSRGGRYQIGAEAEQSFPAEKPAKAFLYQGSNDRLTLKNFEGKSLSFRTPPYSFFQLQDNREWNWPIFEWWFAAPVSAGQNVYQVQIVPQAGDSAEVRKLVDPFGQSTTVDYANKVRDLAELKADAEAEKAYYAAITPPAFDPFGGLPDSGQRYGLKKTGFFHLEKHQSRWLLVDPAGNAFFQLGVCGFAPCDDYTYVEGRESMYEWIPPFEGQFRSAYRENDRHVVSFHLANTIRKYQAAYDLDDYLTRMMARARKWGFNSGGAFSPLGKRAHWAAQFPYVLSLPLNAWEGFAHLPGVEGAWDPFDPQNRQRVERNFAEQLPARADDPLLIGYFLVNEPLFEHLPKALPALGGKFACKRQLVDMLREQYQNIDRFNKAWNASAAGFDELVERGLSVSTKAAAADMQRFTGLFLEAYFKLVTETYHKYDQKHLLLGCRLQPGTINDEQLCRLCGRYVDVMSFNYYTDRIEPQVLDQVYARTGERPILLSEFYYSSSKDTGLIGGAKQVASQLNRGLAYRNYVEQAAALNYVVGIEWFTLVDQSVTGRWFSRYNGESANTGLIAVTDRPWKIMLAEMMKTNSRIYDVLFGVRPPSRLPLEK